MSRKDRASKYYYAELGSGNTAVLDKEHQVTVMNRAKALSNLGQSVWLDHPARNIVDDGTLQYYATELSVAGLMSNLKILCPQIKSSTQYSAAIHEEVSLGRSSGAVFYELALGHMTRAADLLRFVHHDTNGVDGWLSLDLSPLLAYDAALTTAAATDLAARAGRQNVLIKIPGTKEGLAAIEEAVFAGVSVNVTLLFSREHYLDAAGAYLRGIERRISAGLDTRVGSVASVTVGSWDAAVSNAVPESLHGKLAIAIGQRIYKAYCDLLSSPRCKKIVAAGYKPQRLGLTIAGTERSDATDIGFIKALAARRTFITMSEATLLAFAERGEIGAAMPEDGGDCELALAEFAKVGIDLDAVAAKLQYEGIKELVELWSELVTVVRRIESR